MAEAEVAKPKPLTPEQKVEKQKRAESWQLFDAQRGLYDHQTPQTHWLPQSKEKQPVSPDLGALESVNPIRKPKAEGSYLVYYVDPTPSLMKRIKRHLPLRSVENPEEVAEDQGRDIQNKTLQSDSRLGRVLEAIPKAPAKMKNWLLEEQCKSMYLNVDANGHYSFGRTPKTRKERLDGYRLMIQEYARNGEKELVFDFPNLREFSNLDMSEVMEVLKIAEAAGVSIVPGKTLNAKVADLGTSPKAFEFKSKLNRVNLNYHENQEAKVKHEGMVHDGNALSLNARIGDLQAVGANAADSSAAMTRVANELNKTKRSLDLGKPSQAICQEYDKTLKAAEEALAKLGDKVAPENKAQYDALVKQTKEVKALAAFEASPAEKRADENAKGLNDAVAKLEEATNALSNPDAAKVKAVGEACDAVKNASDKAKDEAKKPEAELAKTKLPVVEKALKSASGGLDKANAALNKVEGFGTEKADALKKHESAARAREEATESVQQAKLSKEERVADDFNQGIKNIETQLSSSKPDDRVAGLTALEERLNQVQKDVDSIQSRKLGLDAQHKANDPSMGGAQYQAAQKSLAAEKTAAEGRLVKVQETIKKSLDGYKKDADPAVSAAANAPEPIYSSLPGTATGGSFTKASAEAAFQAMAEASPVASAAPVAKPASTGDLAQANKLNDMSRRAGEIKTKADDIKFEDPAVTATSARRPTGPT